MIMSSIVWRAHTRISDAIEEAVRGAADYVVIHRANLYSAALSAQGAPSIAFAENVARTETANVSHHMGWATRYEGVDRSPLAVAKAEIHLANAVLCEQVANAYDDLARAMRTQAHGGPSGVGSDANHIGR